MQKFPIFHSIKAYNTVISEIIRNRHIAAVYTGRAEQFLQLRRSAANLCEVQLVGAAHQIVDTGEVLSTILTHLHPDIALPEEFQIRACLCLKVPLLLQKAVTGKAVMSRVDMGSLGEKIPKSGNNGHIFSSHPGAALHHFLPVGGVVIDEHDVHRAQVHLPDDFLYTVSLGRPVHGREHEQLCHTLSAEPGSYLSGIVFGTNGTHDTGTDGILKQLLILRRKKHLSLGKCSLPKGLIQIPNQ